ncbi:MAG TPA: quinolinate synthase NadA [Dehalococcoidia bacterium]|nr:quinolinate synthase NadA [Dehalococcoidia bacterium]
MQKKDADLVQQLNQLKKERNAVILVHNYQRAEVQDIGDFVGDSLELSRKAAEIDADVIVFCGVHFMAETAAILNPDRIVILPDSHAGCPMADMITADRLREKKKEIPDASVVCYVNSSAEVKAESDVCCTSANAVRVIENLDSGEILFVPDQYLGHFVSTRTGREMHLWPGYCPTHARIQREDILQKKQEYPQAKVVVHPECRPEVTEMADAILSTSGICRYAAQPEVRELIVGTENGIIHRLQKENPDTKFIPLSERAVCPNMKLITLEKVVWSLQEMETRVIVPEPIRIRAKRSVDRMLETV